VGLAIHYAGLATWRQALAPRVRRLKVRAEFGAKDSNTQAFATTYALSGSI